jgi:hypothetical protein
MAETQTHSGNLDRRHLQRWAEESVFEGPLKFANIHPTNAKYALSGSEAFLLRLWNRVLTRPADLLTTPTDNFLQRGGVSINVMVLVHILHSEASS